MAITPMTEDLDIIAALPDEPNDEGGLTAAQLKAKFDEAGNKIKDYVNDELIPSIVSTIADVQAAAGNVPIGGTTGQVITKISDADNDYGWGDAGTSAATADTVMRRDADGRAQIADPSADADIANKGYVDSAVSGVSGSVSMVKISSTTTESAASSISVVLPENITDYSAVILYAHNFVNTGDYASAFIRLNGVSSNYYRVAGTATCYLQLMSFARDATTPGDSFRLELLLSNRNVVSHLSGIGYSGQYYNSNTIGSTQYDYIPGDELETIDLSTAGSFAAGITLTLYGVLK